MKMKKFLTGIVTAVMCMTVVGAGYVHADTKSAKIAFTTEYLKNLQDFLLGRKTPDLNGKDCDLNSDGRVDVFDLCLMRQECIKSNNQGKTLVAYYSASGTTEKIATYIADAMNADLFEITPINEYTDSDLNWTDSESRVVREHNDLANVHVELVQNKPDNFDKYDNVFIGYPIWWQEASWVVNDFVTENDFTGKNVIPFCTSMSSPLGASGTKLAEKSGTGNWLDGIRFTSRSSEEDVQKWAKGLDLTKPVTANKTLIAYLSYPLSDGTDANGSASRVIVDDKLYGSVEYMAKIIEKNTDADVFEIQPAESYGNDFNTVADRALDEQENNILPELLNHIENLDQYDTIFIGYPVWWYDMPQMMYSFFDEYDFSGKTIIPFNSHGGSGFSGSVQKIAGLEPDADVRTDGLSISRTVMTTSEENIVNWLEKIGMKKVS